ncbi:nuclear transport factor 2 family protein [Nocardioides aquiterrae]|uniref:Nuclear transport factor 2 family protein n=1 Tax=Nocardioides aquiterrae TaxID=203799 RepID=A0ABN1UF48_9ACTN
MLEAARRLVDAFGAHDVASYFDGFAADATFVFPNCPAPLESRAEYEATWQDWEQDGFRVEGCTSSDPRVQLLTDDVAVFTHRVTTALAGEEAPQHERETIVFRRDAAGRWLGVHEHLSPDPTA